MTNFLLFLIVLLLWGISWQLEDRDPTKSHAEWKDGKWNGRP